MQDATRAWLIHSQAIPELNLDLPNTHSLIELVTRFLPMFSSVHLLRACFFERHHQVIKQYAAKIKMATEGELEWYIMKHLQKKQALQFMLEGGKWGTQYELEVGKELNSSTMNDSTLKSLVSSYITNEEKSKAEREESYAEETEANKNKAASNVTRGARQIRWRAGCKNWIREKNKKSRISTESPSSHQIILITNYLLRYYPQLKISASERWLHTTIRVPILKKSILFDRNGEEPLIVDDISHPVLIVHDCIRCCSHTRHLPPDPKCNNLQHNCKEKDLCFTTFSEEGQEIDFHNDEKNPRYLVFAPEQNFPLPFF